MAEKLVLYDHKEPSYFNKDALLGALIGISLPIGGVFAATAAIMGGILGGYVGHERTEFENRNGKIVKEPSGWNKETAIGALIGLKVSELAIMAAIATGAIGVAVGGPVGGGVALASIGAALLAIPAVTAIGAYIGSGMGKERMTQEYSMAIAQEQARALSRISGREPVMEATQEPSRQFQEMLDKQRTQTAIER